MTNNSLFTEVSCHSLIKYGEELCGDHFEMIEPDDDSIIVVLADGMGSGVKASILSTLTSKIISTMLANNLSLEECVSTIASTLPVNSEVGVAYSTFTIIRIWDNSEVQILIYDNPDIIFMRNGKIMDLAKSEIQYGDKKIKMSYFKLKEGDCLLGFSDGALHASSNNIMNFDWDLKDIKEFVAKIYDKKMTANMYTSILLDECNRLYGGKPKDDVSVFTVRIRKRETANMLIGPPRDPKDVALMLSLFFSKEGKRIVCGGTTSELAAEYLGKDVIQGTVSYDKSIPPMGEIEGVDLVTEGTITLNRVLAYAKKYLEDSEDFDNWSSDMDAAFVMARIIFEEVTDINMFVGRAENKAHLSPNLAIGYSIKMKIVEELEECLKKMGKKVKVRYF